MSLWIYHITWSASPNMHRCKILRQILFWWSSYFLIHNPSQYCVTRIESRLDASYHESRLMCKHELYLLGMELVRFMQQHINTHVLKDSTNREHIIRIDIRIWDNKFILAWCLLSEAKFICHVIWRVDSNIIYYYLIRWDN